MPTEIYPMLATLTESAFDDRGWLFEIKWDGYRAVAYANNSDVQLISRNLIAFTDKYAPVTEALKALHIHAVMDGEVVAVNDKGIAVFQSLQNWQNTPVHLQYCIFDIIWLQGYDLSKVPLIERKRILQEILPADHEVIKYSDHVLKEGKKFFEVALAQGLEGMMAKNINSFYEVNSRTKEWLKVKVNQRQEVVIAGYTTPRHTRKFFGSLLLGLYEGKELIYIGHTGSGFTEKTLEEMYRLLQPLVTNKIPFSKEPKTNMPATWVQPTLVCEIKFTEWTQSRIARHPIFMGLRTDKKAKDVTFETSENMAKLKTTGKQGKKSTPVTTKEEQPVKRAGKTPKEKKPLIKNSEITSPRSGPSLMVGENNQEVVLNKHPLQLTNLNKLYWKKEKFTKGDMVRYYLEIAPYIIPYMKDRPQSLNRHPDGIDGPNFYQKDMKGKVPSWIKTHKDFSESTNQHVEYLVCSNEATLVYMANLGCIEMHPWHSRYQTWQWPDWCLIDLDPDTNNSFDQVMEVARVVKKVLDAIGADAYCKTSGSSGIHIYIPLEAKYTYDQSKQLAELVVTLVHQELPEITSLERSPSKRKGKLYLDYLQNRETQTAAAPYTLRPKPGMPVSTPLDWSELKKGLTPTTYNANNILMRVKKEGDLFQPVLGKGIQLEKVLAALTKQMK